MRNNVYSDIFWYGDMILPVWAKNQIFQNFIYNTYEKLWGHDSHQLAHLNIHKDWSRNVSWKNVTFQNVITPLFLIRFSSFLHQSVGKFLFFLLNLW